MSNCQCSANSQLKAIQARLDRVDNDLMAHYAGISTLVKGLAANPVTVGATVAVAPIYNLSATGQTLLKKLVGLLPGVEQFKHLQHIDAAGLVENMAATFAASIANVAITAGQQIIDSTAAQATAALNLANGIAAGLSELELAPLRAAVAEANSVVAAANSAMGMLTGFINTLSDISNCRTRSNLIQP